MEAPARRADVFRYLDADFDATRGELVCRYALDDLPFEERITIGRPTHDTEAAVAEAARLVHLLAGVSYFKAGAPDVIDLGTVPVRDGEREFLRDYYGQGLGEFAYRNGITLDLRIVGGADAGAVAPFSPPSGRPLVPFGGGIDSIVTVETIRREDAVEPSLFVVSHHSGRFTAIEDPVAVTGLPVVRAERRLDDKILRSADFGFLTGHVPVTGLLSGIAVLSASAHGHDAVVMSNEWSASAGNVEVDGRIVNHQYSKSAAFERGFGRVLAGAFDQPPAYFSLLRSWSELAIARRFSQLGQYHRAFHSCNRAFFVDPDKREPAWCGRCDKCCFIDLVLAPFMSPDELGAVFRGREPLADDGLVDQFRTLLALSDDFKPFECVGDVDECRTAAVMAFDRDDRRGWVVLQALVDELGGDADVARAAAVRLLEPMGPSNVPDGYATPHLLG